MSCDAAAALFLFFASATPGQVPAVTPAVAMAPASVAAEPLFADIVVRARGLEAEVKDYRAHEPGACSDRRPWQPRGIRRALDDQRASRFGDRKAEPTGQRIETPGDWHFAHPGQWQ